MVATSFSRNADAGGPEGPKAHTSVLHSPSIHWHEVTMGRENVT